MYNISNGCCRRHLSGVNTYSIFLSVPLAKFTLLALDYPPFFAYFEKLLSIPAFLIDPKIVDVNNLNYDAWSVIAYQRATVIVTEVVLGIVLLQSLLPLFYYHFIVS
jgi:ALG6, ALG8 glycosyltransferase family